MKFLMIALRDNDHVTSLALGGNKLNVPTCRYIQRELRTKPNITELSIVYNQPCLDFRDARDFCGMLQQSPHIRSVDFSRNLMLEEGAQELLNTVTNWPYLTQVRGPPTPTTSLLSAPPLVPPPPTALGNALASPGGGWGLGKKTSHRRWRRETGCGSCPDAICNEAEKRGMRNAGPGRRGKDGSAG